MFKKLLSFTLVAACVAMMSVASYATEPTTEVSDEEIFANGTHVESEVFEAEGEKFVKDVYVYTEELPSTRSAEQTFIQTTACYINSLEKSPRLTNPVQDPESKTRSSIIYVTSSSATGYPDHTGYRLTRATAQVGSGMTGVTFERLTAYCHDYQTPNNPQTYSLSGSGNVVKYLSFNGYVADVYGGMLGTYLEFDFRGESITLPNFLFNN